MKFEDLPRTDKFKAGDIVRHKDGSSRFFVATDVLTRTGHIRLNAVDGEVSLVAKPGELELVPTFVPGFYRVWNDGDIGYRHNTFGHANNSELYPNDDAVAGILEITDDGTTTMHPAISGGGDQ